MASSQAQPARPVFAIFQGGGAAGIAHLGGVAAAEEEGLEFIGVAGASAGAFVAALLAAGYRGKELFNPETRGSDLLSRYGKKPLELLDPERWDEAQELYRTSKAVPWLVHRRWWNLLWIKTVFRRRSAITSQIKVLARGLRERGHFDATGVREFVNWALREKLREAYAETASEQRVPDRVCFFHLDNQKFRGFRPLKIIATDVNKRQAALFSQTINASVEVGAAVAASISIPAIFRPVSLSDLPDGLFADGGLVSNLPTWTFVEEKLAYERTFPDEDRVPILAFTLAEPPKQIGPLAQVAPETGKKPGNPVATTLGLALAYGSDVVRAGIFGSQALGQQLIADVIVIPLQPRLGVLAFDAAWPAIIECFNDGKRDAKRAFELSLRLRPDRVRAQLKITVDGMRQRVDAVRTALEQAPVSRIRGAIVVPLGSASLRVLTMYGADTEADDNLLLDRNGPGCARAFRERDIFIVKVNRDQHGRPQFTPAAPMTRYEASLMWRDLRSMACIPIFSDRSSWTKAASERVDEPLGVLSLDSDEDLGPYVSQETLRDWLIEQSVILSPVLAKGTW